VRVEGGPLRFPPPDSEPASGDQQGDQHEDRAESGP